MAARSPNLRVAAARAGAAARSGDPDRVVQTRRDLAAARIEAYIEQVIAAAPPLTPEQRSRLAVLLTPAADAA